VNFNNEIQKEFVFSQFEDLPFSEPVFSGNVIQPTDSVSAISFSDLLLLVYAIGARKVAGKTHGNILWQKTRSWNMLGFLTILERKITSNLL
jgi:hypothetical protein